LAQPSVVGGETIAAALDKQGRTRSVAQQSTGIPRLPTTVIATSHCDVVEAVENTGNGSDFLPGKAAELAIQ